MNFVPLYPGQLPANKPLYMGIFPLFPLLAGYVEKDLEAFFAILCPQVQCKIHYLTAADETKIFGIETETETRSMSGRDSRLRLRPESLRSRD